MAAVRRMVRQIAEKFQPDKIILFGSYAYGTPNEHSDIDILVVMPAKNEINQAVRICQAVDYTFPMDLIVSTPEDLHRRLELEDWFLREITTKGKVLYERNDGRMGSKGGRGRRVSQKAGQSKTTSP